MKLETLFTRFHGRCVYCGAEVTLQPRATAPTSATRDHFIPRSKGGTNADGNQVLACFGCNQSKGDMDPRLILFTWLWLNPDSFRAAIERIGPHAPANTPLH